MRLEQIPNHRWIATALLFSLLGVYPLQAEDSRWAWIGPEGGRVEDLIPDARNPSLWYAIVGPGLYRSNDYGNTWKPTGQYGVRKTLVHPVDSRVVALTRTAGRSKIWTSLDLGRTFHETASLNFFLRDVWNDPGNPKVLFGVIAGQDYPNGGDRALATSTDGGIHWSEFDNLPVKPGSRFHGCSIEFYSFEDFIVPSFAPNTLYATGSVIGRNGREECGRFQTFFSPNRGTDWRILPEGLGIISKDPRIPDRVFSMAGWSLKRLTARGLEPVSENTPFCCTRVFSVPRRESVLYALHGGIWRSTDSGKSWKKKQVDLKGGTYSLAALDHPRQTLLLGSPLNGVWRSTPTMGWIPSSSGQREASVGRIEISGGSTLFATVQSHSTSYRNLFRANASRLKWENLNESLPHLPIELFWPRVNPAIPGNFFLSGNSIWGTTDGGTSWTRTKGSRDSDILFDPHRPQVVYVNTSTWDDKTLLFKSTNQGATFQDLPETIQGSLIRMIFDENDPQTIYYVIAYEGIFKSSDGGRTLSKEYSGVAAGGPRDMAPLPQPSAYVMVTENGGVYRTLDGARSWRLLSRISTGSALRIYADETGKRLFIVTGAMPPEYTLLESLDRGVTWHDIRGQFGPLTSVYSMTDPRKHPFYVATSHGVFREARPCRLPSAF